MSTGWSSPPPLSNKGSSSASGTSLSSGPMNTELSPPPLIGAGNSSSVSSGWAGALAFVEGEECWDDGVKDEDGDGDGGDSEVVLSSKPMNTELFPPPLIGAAISSSVLSDRAIPLVFEGDCGEGGVKDDGEEDDEGSEVGDVEDEDEANGCEECVEREITLFFWFRSHLHSS